MMAADEYSNVDETLPASARIAITAFIGFYGTQQSGSDAGRTARMVIFREEDS